MGRALRWSNNNVLSYKNTFAQAHKLDLMLGHETSFQGNEYLLGQAKDLPFDDLGNDNLALGATPSQVSTTRAASRRLSFFARGFYSYKDRYMLTATMRADASTVFSDNHKWGFFPSAALKPCSHQCSSQVRPGDFTSVLQNRLRTLYAQ